MMRESEKEELHRIAWEHMYSEMPRGLILVGGMMIVICLALYGACHLIF